MIDQALNELAAIRQRLAAGTVAPSRIDDEVARARQLVTQARASLRRSADAIAGLEEASR